MAGRDHMDHGDEMDVVGDSDCEEVDEGGDGGEGEMGEGGVRMEAKGWWLCTNHVAEGDLEGAVKDVDHRKPARSSVALDQR